MSHTTQVLYRAVTRVRPTEAHPLKGWAFGWLAIFLWAPSREAADIYSRAIIDHLPYQIVNTFGRDQVVGVHPAKNTPPPLGHEEKQREAERSAQAIGFGCFLLHAPIGTDEEDFTHLSQ